MGIVNSTTIIILVFVKVYKVNIVFLLQKQNGLDITARLKVLSLKTRLQLSF